MRQGVAGPGMDRDYRAPRLELALLEGNGDAVRFRAGFAIEASYHPEGLDDRRRFTHSPWRRSGW